MCADTPDTPVPADMFTPPGAAGAMVTPDSAGVEQLQVTRWKRTTPRTDKGKTHRYPARARKCAQCGQVYTPLRKTGRYCSNACRQAAFKARRRKARKRAGTSAQSALIVHTCPHCTRTWLDRPNTLRVYCSGACTQAAYKARKRATVRALGALLALDHGKAFDLVERLGTTRARQQLQRCGLEYCIPARTYVSLGAA